MTLEEQKTCDRLAIKVMGWESKTAKGVGGISVKVWGGKKNNIMAVSHWNPLVNVEQAIKCRDALLTKMKGLEFASFARPQGRIKIEIESGDELVSGLAVVADTDALATCLAIIKVLDAEKGIK